MDGIHDMGGMHGFGPVRIEPDEPVFHSRWEAHVFALSGLAGAVLGGSVDEFRHSLEKLDPVTYLANGYYGRWLAALERRLVAAGLVDRDDLARAARELAVGGEPPTPPPPRAEVAAGEQSETENAAEDGAGERAAPGTVFREVPAEPIFHVGQKVRTRNMHPAGHTRLPRYARAKRGEIAAAYPACVFPDTNAHGRGEQPQYLYNVAFDGAELWGDDAEPGTRVYLDLFEPYLEPADV